MHETWVWSLGQEDPLEKEMATCFQYFCQGNLMGREAWWTTVHGVAKKLDVTEQLSMHPHLNVGKTQESWVSPPNGCNPVYLFIFSFIFISWRLITLQYCSGFCHPLTWISHGFTCIPHPDAPSHLPLYPLPLGLPSAPGLSICLMHPTWAGDLFHLACFDAVLLKHPTLAFSHRVQKSVLYICVSFSVLHIGLSLPSF